MAEGLTNLKSQFEWHHFGEYSKVSSFEYNNMLKQKLKPIFNSENKVKFWGFVSNSDLIKIIKENNFDLHINLSEYEGIPVTIMESMSLGIPVIATDVGGVSEIVTDGVNGFLLPPNVSAEIVAKTIEKYYGLTINEKNKLRKNAYITWNEKFNSEKNYNDFINRILAL